MSKKTGRPATKVDWNYVDNLLRAGVDGASIAQMIGIHPDTLYEAQKRDHSNFPTFTAYSHEKRKVGLDLLKAKQYDLAMKGDKTMLVWLGKQYLGQAEKVDNKLDADIKVEQITGIQVK